MKPSLLALFLALALLTGCASPPAKTTQSRPVANYQFVVIEPTSRITSVVARDGDLRTAATDPANLIEGILLKKGLVRVPPEGITAREKTLMVRWGISGRRDILLGAAGYAQEVTLSLIDASSMEAVYRCSAEGLGMSDAEDIHKAIASCLAGLQ